MKKLFLSINIALLMLITAPTAVQADDVYEYRAFGQKKSRVKKKRYKKRRRHKASISRKIMKRRAPEKTLEISASYMQTNISADGLDLYDAKGLEVSGGKIFRLGSSLKTTSSLILRYGSAKFSNDTINHFFEIAEISLTLNEIGFSQKLGYELGANSFKIVPFIAPNIFYGSISAEDLYGNGHSNKFYRYGADLGVNFDFRNNISPFASFNMSKVKFDNLGESADYKSFVIGMAFRF